MRGPHPTPHLLPHTLGFASCLACFFSRPPSLSSMVLKTGRHLYSLSLAVTCEKDGQEVEGRKAGAGLGVAAVAGWARHFFFAFVSLPSMLSDACINYSLPSFPSVILIMPCTHFAFPCLVESYLFIYSTTDVHAFPLTLPFCLAYPTLPSFALFLPSHSFSHTRSAQHFPGRLACARLFAAAFSGTVLMVMPIQFSVSVVMVFGAHSFALPSTRLD